MIWTFKSKFCPTLFNPITSLVIKHEFLYETLIGKWMQKVQMDAKKPMTLLLGHLAHCSPPNTVNIMFENVEELAFGRGFA